LQCRVSIRQLSAVHVADAADAGKLRADAVNDWKVTRKAARHSALLNSRARIARACAIPSGVRLSDFVLFFGS
jgi:hypothetical protein